MSDQPEDQTSSGRPDEERTEESATHAPPRVPSRQMSDDELLAEEARGRLVGFISIVVVACLSAFFFFLWIVQKDAEGGSELDDRLRLINEHAGSFIASQFFLAVGVLFTGAILSHLALAVTSRVPTAPKMFPIICVAGPALIAVVLPIFTVLEVGIASDFVDGANQTVKQAEELRSSAGFAIAQGGYLVGSLIYAIAWMMVGILSIRAGLLTKIVGYVAVAIGLANVLAPLAGLAAVVTIFWVGAVTIMLLGRGAQKPPAWVLGRPVPWSEVAANADEIRREEEQAASESARD